MIKEAGMRRQNIAKIILPFILGIFILVIWEKGLFTRAFGIDEYVISRPSKIIRIIITNKDKILINLEDSLIVAIIGLVLGCILGYLIAIIAAIMDSVGNAVITIITALNAVPIIAFATVMTNWTKGVSSDIYLRSMISKIIVVSITTMAVMSINSYRGLKDLPRYTEDLLKSMAAGKGLTLVKLRIPNSVPYIFYGLRVAVPLSVITTLVSEYFAEYITGIGRQIRENILLAQFATAWAYIFIACLIGVTFYFADILIETLVLRKRSKNYEKKRIIKFISFRSFGIWFDSLRSSRGSIKGRSRTLHRERIF